MRRSLAPSLRSNSNESQFQKPIPQLKTSTGLTPKTFEIITEDVENNSGSLCFSVVWGKRTTKKHKTWEGDGTLEDSNGRFVLKDVSGTILGSSNSLKSEDIYEGNRLLIGSKEVEIQEKLSNATVTPTANTHQTIDNSEDVYEKPKKRKSSSVFTPNLHIAKMRLPPSTSGTQACPTEKLTLPIPSLAHQIKYNVANDPINEVKVSHTLSKSLRSHQRDGVIFLYECIQGFRDLNSFGAILADDMGLGKTLQCLTVCHILLKNSPYGRDSVLKKILIVTPSSLTHHWSEEVSKWLSCEGFFSFVVDSKNKLKHYPNTSRVPFLIISYEMLLKNSEDFQNMKFDLLICDEGHRLKNNEIKAAVCLRQLDVKRRIVLTGTPIQNDLQEFYSLVDFVNPGILGEYNEYRQKFEKPIIQSQAPDASGEVKTIGEECAEELNKITSKFILRRTQLVNKEYLPKKTEFIVFVRPTELQQLLLENALEWFNSRDGLMGHECTALQIIMILKKICNHPSLIRTTQHDHPLVQHLLQFLPNWNEMGPFDSSKLELVQNFLRESIVECKERVVLVSNHTKTLDMLAGLCSHFNYSFLRLDGATTISDRNLFVDKFNKPKSNVSVFLLSAKAGGVGLNLSGASRLILFDNDWNPAIDLQAMSRIWRDGQKRDVKIYRLITAGTIEEKIFQRQIAKTSLSSCVMDQRYKFDAMKMSEDDLKDIFTIQEDYNSCSTHSFLECKCDGNGENLQKFTQNQGKLLLVDTPSFPEEVEQNNVFQVNELMSWKHFKSPIRCDVLKEACLTDSVEDIIFMFSNTTEINVNN